MRDAERHALHTELLRNFRRLTRYRQGGPPAHLPHYFQIHPSHAAPPACSQRLHGRLFCRKSPRVAFVLILEPLAVLALPARIHSPQEYFAVAANRPLASLPLRDAPAR